MKYEEKMQALDLLDNACEQVNKAMDAIEVFAKKHGLKHREEERTISLRNLAAMVAEESGVRPTCAYNTLRTAFRILKKQDLSLTIEEDREHE